MKKFVWFITAILFLIPFFWLKPGFVDLGGDAGRSYFIDPWASIQYLISQENVYGAQQLSLVPYEYFLYIVKFIVGSPTYLIATTNGLILSLAFLFSYLTVRELLWVTAARSTRCRDIAALTGGIIYVSFITNSGWSQALYTHNQIFLNPLIFYLLLRLCLTSSMKYGLAILGVTLVFSENFGFAAMPQLVSFFPPALVFLFMFSHFIAHVAFPWNKLLCIVILFIGLHAFHIFPLAAAVFDKTTTLNGIIFSTKDIEFFGIKYFDANHIDLGKVSMALFSPSTWRSQNVLALFVPMIVVLGFLKRRSKLLLLTGLFFAVTLFLVSANITQIGVQFYRSLFYIPGFLMFRSFNDRWYYVFSFFYTLLFAFSFYEAIKRWKIGLTVITALSIICLVTYRIFPFLQGKALYTPLYQSNNVNPVFMMDPDMMDALEFTKKLPHDGKVLTVPLTFPYYQIAYGKQGGAYRGISLVATVAGHRDYPGFWAFGKYEKPVFDALQRKDIDAFLSLLQRLEVRYIFRNSDPRIMDDFPGYPYVFPGMTYSNKDELPIIRDQKAYDKLIAKLPVKKVFEKGFYTIYEFEDSPSYPQSYRDPNLHPYFVFGRIVSIATLCIIIAGIGVYFIKKMKKKRSLIYVSLFLFLMIAGVVLLDLAGSSNYSDIPFLLVFSLYAIVIIIQQSQSALTFRLAIYERDIVFQEEFSPVKLFA